MQYRQYRQRGSRPDYRWTRLGIQSGCRGRDRAWMCPGSLLRLVKVGVGRRGCSIISSLLGFEVSNDLLNEEADVEYSRYYLDDPVDSL